MKPPALDYARPERLEEALALLAEAGEEARPLAGGQSLMPILNMRLAAPRILVDIGAIDALGTIREEGDTLVVGAGVTQAALLAYAPLAPRWPLLARALPHVGHFQTRNRGTVCGSLAHADPSAELPLCLATLGGEVVLRAAHGERRLGADAFFLGMLSTARRPDELLVEARIPAARAGWRYAFDEIALRHGDFAIVSVAVAAGEDSLHIGVGGVAERPVVVSMERPPADRIEEVLNDLAWSLEAQGDHAASAAYRREMVRVLGRRLIEETSP